MEEADAYFVRNKTAMDEKECSDGMKVFADFYEENNVTVQHPVKGTLIFGQNRENKISVSSLL